MYEEPDWMLVDDYLHVEEGGGGERGLGSIALALQHVHAWPSARTLRMKSGGVPGLTVGRRTPSW